MPVRVFACVSESVFLKGLESVFPDGGDLVYCGGAVDEPTLFDQLPRAKPDVLVYELGGEHQLAYLSVLRRNYPALRIVVLLDPESEHLAISATERGAARCLLKTLTSQTLLTTLSRLNAGGGAGGECAPFELSAAGAAGRRVADYAVTVERVGLESLFRELAARQVRA
jgi:DNA-binding NarL/FixJ family response regulator